MVGIYSITSPSNRVYIGQSIDDIKARWRMHKRCLKSGCTFLNNSIKKYGFDSHELKVLHELPADVSQEVINDYELFYWQQYKYCGFEMLNLMTPGNNSKHSEGTRAKISESLIGNSFAAGYKHTDETKKRISNTSTGRKYPNRKVSDEVLVNIKRLAELNTGRRKSEEAIEKTRQFHTGRKRSEESKKKMSEAAKGKVISDETKRKMSESMKGRNVGKRSPEWIEKMVKGRWGK